MKSALILALAGSAVAAPSLGGFFDALFGRGNNDNSFQPSDFLDFKAVGTGSGIPFPTATGAPFPTGTSGVQPSSGSDSQEKHNVKALHIDYELAPKAAPAAKRREVKYRQLGGSALPSFSLLNPSDTPTATESATGLPTALPTGFSTPSAGGPTATLAFPTGEVPFPTAPAGTGAPDFSGLPTTLGTITRGPQPTAAPDAPEQEGEETENGNAWLEWISNLLSGGKGSQK